MHGVLRFWLDRGVDGFRADVIHCIGKDPELPDDPPAGGGIPHSALNDVPVTHERLRDIRSVIDSYPGDRLMVGEVYLLSTAAIATYYGDGDELQLAFNFPPLYARWQADRWRACIDQTVEPPGPEDAWPSWVLSNHDNPRHRTRYDRAGPVGEDGPTAGRRSEARARAAAVLLLTLRGTPFLYQGEELGLLDAIIPADGGSTRAAATAAGHPSRGTGPPSTAGRSPAGAGALAPVPARPGTAEPRRPSKDDLVHPAPLPAPDRPASPRTGTVGGRLRALGSTRGMLGYRGGRASTSGRW